MTQQTESPDTPERFTAEDAVAEGAVEVAGEVVLDAAADLLVGFALGAAALDVGQGRRVAAHPGDGDGVQGAVELAAAEAVEAVSVGAADDTGTGAVPESMPKAASLRMRPAWDQDSRICAALSAPRPGSAATRPGAMSSTIAAICASRSAATSARAAIRWPRRISVWCSTRVCRSSRPGRSAPGAYLARRSRGRVAAAGGSAGSGRPGSRPAPGAQQSWRTRRRCCSWIIAALAWRFPVGAHVGQDSAGEQLAGSADGVDQGRSCQPGAFPAWRLQSISVGPCSPRSAG